MLTLDVTLNYREAGTPDAYNQPTTGALTPVTVKGYLRPLRTNTTVIGGDAYVSDASVIVRPLTRLTGLESVEVGGRRYSVDGEPQAHYNPVSRVLLYHQVYLRRGVN